MQNLNKKQKIILSILASIIIISIGYYVYSKDEKYEELEIDENLQISNENNNTNINNEQLENQEEENKEKIVVHVSGAVNKEGIVELEEDSRIADAIEKAGGLKEDANMNEVNLAYKLEDGMKIYIPSNKDQEIQERSNIGSGIESNTTNKKANSKININTATQEELDSLPGIGPSTALKIINYRKEHGKFSKVEELKNVSGIGDSKFAQLKDLITV